MDPATLAHQVMTALTPLAPYLGSVGTAIATKMGEDVYQQGKKLYQLIHVRFAKEPDSKASKALQNFVEDPDDYGSIFEQKLIPIVQSDPTFARELLQIIQTGPIQSLILEEEAKASQIRMSNTSGKGTQDIRGGKRSIIEDVQMNIE